MKLVLAANTSGFLTEEVFGRLASIATILPY